MDSTITTLVNAIERGYNEPHQSEAHREALRVLLGALEDLEGSVSQGADGQALLERWDYVGRALLDEALTGPSLGAGAGL